MIDYLESFKFIHNSKLNDFTLYWTGLHTIIIINSNEPYLDNFIEQFKIFINKMEITSERSHQILLNDITIIHPSS
jgi:hypothetical protein